MNDGVYASPSSSKLVWENIRCEETYDDGVED
jgi:hypothetical protein